MREVAAAVDYSGMLDFNASEFHFSLPVWVAVEAAPASTEARAIGISQLVQGIAVGESDEGPFVIVFTDLDLVERFVGRDLGVPLAPAFIGTADDLVRFLDAVERAGFGLVGFDPGHRVRVIPLRRVLDAVRLE